MYPLEAYILELVTALSQEIYGRAESVVIADSARVTSASGLASSHDSDPEWLQRDIG